MIPLGRITKNPAVMDGKPCIRGMRVTAGMLVGLVASGWNEKKIIDNYPYIEKEDIRQALQYAAWQLQGNESPLEEEKEAENEIVVDLAGKHNESCV
jgi:uncharacterized protein (DUF433 family)